MTTATIHNFGLTPKEAAPADSNSGLAHTGEPLAIPYPLSGQTYSVDMIPAGAVRLSFNPDDATVTRSGDNLTFVLEQGGSVTINDFFVVEDGGDLPELILPDGAVVPAALAFGDSDLDLTTAAGPGATGAAPGNGASDYADNPGSLIEGIDRLGSLGTDYWGRGTEYSDIIQSLADPDDFGLDIPPDVPALPGGAFGMGGSVYEDGLPYQHLGDRDTFEPGKLYFTFAPSGTTIVTGIHLSGFHEGTVIYFGDPSDPDTPRVIVTGPDQVLDFSPEDFEAGVYIVPPHNSDQDMDINAVVDMMELESGMRDSLSGGFTVKVDAVADMPVLGDGIGAVADTSGHHAFESDSREYYDNGYNIVESTATAGPDGIEVTLTVTVSATFDDYLDGSENHYLLVQTHPDLRIDLSSLPEGCVYLGTIVINGVEYHQIGVDNSVIEADGGTVTLPVTFLTTAGSDGNDQTFNLKVGAYAEEDVDPSGEIDLTNNTAHVVTDTGTGATVDVINSSLTIKVGWAYESNDGSKHLAGGYNPNFPGMDGGKGVDPDSTGANGAPIRIGLDGNARGSAEFISSAELTFDHSRGELLINGEPVYDGMQVQGANGVTYDFAVDPATGTVTVTVNGQVSNLDELNMTFRPDASGGARYDDSDVDLSFKVTVSNEAGAKATFEGKTEIIIDAVADRPELGGGLAAEGDSSGHVSDRTDSSEEYSKGTNTVSHTVSAGEEGGGATVTVTVNAFFEDYRDGSESHSLLVQTDGHLQIDLSSLPEGYSYLGAVVIDGVEYHKIGVDNALIEAGNGSVSLPVRFTTTGDADEKSGQDEAFELKVGAMAEESVGSSGEHDRDNNTSHVISDDTVKASVDVVNSSLTVTAGWAYEGNNGSKHVSGDYTPGWSGMDGGDGVNPDSTGPDGAPIRIGLDADSGQGADEFITSAELLFDQGRGELLINGEPVYDGMQVEGVNGVIYDFAVDPVTGLVTATVDGQVGTLDELNMSFRPLPGYDDADVGFSYKVNAANTAGATASYEGKTEIVIDAVADKPVGVGGAGVDYGEGKSAAVPGQTVELSFKATFPDTDGSETHTLFIRVDGNNGSAKHGYGENVISPERIKELNDLAGSDLFNTDGDYLELRIPPLSDFGPDNTYTFPDLGITVTYNGDGAYTVSGVSAELPGAETLTDGDKSNGELNGKTGDTSMGFDTVAWAHEGADTKGSGRNENNEHDLGNNDAFTKGSNTVNINTAGGGKADFSLSGGAGFENDQARDNLPLDPSNPRESENNSAEEGGVSLSVTWNFPDGQEYVSELVFTVPLDRYGNPVGDIVYGGKTYSPDSDGTVRIPVDPLDAKKGISEDDLSFKPRGHEGGEVNIGVSATIVDPRSGDSETKDVGEILVGLDAVANRSGEVEGEADYGNGLSAVGTGDKANLTIKTTFSDNDGSERHYVLIQQQPHWKGDYEVGYYDLDGDGKSEPYFKVPVPCAPPEGADENYAGDAHHLSMKDWNILCETGAVTTDSGVTISIPKGADGKWDPSGEWTVEASATLTPPDLSEGRHSLGTGSLAEEYDVNHGTENRDNEHKDNNIAMRPGNEVHVDVNNTEGISVKTGQLYEAGQAHPGGEPHDGSIHVAPSSGDDSFYGNLTISIPSGHGDLYYNGQKLEAGKSYDAVLKDKDGKDVSGKLEVKEENGEISVTFKPDTGGASYKGIDLEVRLRPDDYSDTDISVNVKGSLVNDKSGQKTPGVEGGGEIPVDAVAQDPNTPDKETPGHDPLVPGGKEGLTVTIEAVFKDLTDGSEDHFLLLEAKPGHSYTFTLDGKEYTIDPTSDWPTALGPDGSLYYKIPAAPDAQGKASLEVTVKVTQPYFGGSESEIKYGSMSEDTPTDSGELTYDNNIAINLDGSLTVDVDLDQGGDDPVSVGIAYENNTPNAHLGQDGEDDKQYAKVELPGDADEIRLHPGEGSIMMLVGDEYVKLEPDANGWVTVPKGAEGDIFYAAPDNYSDKDLSLGYQIKGGQYDGRTGSEPVYVDAVAQQGTVDGTGVKTGAHPEGGAYSHVGEGDVTVTVSLSGLDDPDPSTAYYALIEAKPGWECLEEGAELVMIGDKAYFRVPIDPAKIEDGKTTVGITMKSPQAGSGGELHEEFEVGSMVVDRPTDSGEYDMKNNVAVNVDGTVTIDKSVVDTRLSLKVSETYEDNLGDPASISVSGVGAHDEVTELHFSVDAAQGEFLYNGQPLPAEGYSDEFITITVTEAGGKTVISIKPAPPATGFSEQDLKNYINGKLGVAPAEGNTSSKDLDLDWGYSARDILSGDTGGAEGTKKVVVDAVAHRPEVTEYSVDYGEGRQAAKPGDTVTVKGVVEFTKIAAEANYILVQFTPGWEVDGITLAVNGGSIHFSADEIRDMELFYPNGAAGGGAYYKVPLEKDGTTLNPGVGEGGKYTVDVEVEAKVPESGVNGDTQGKLGIGGAAVDSYTDGETDLANNVASDTESTDGDGNGIAIGIVDTVRISAEQIGETPEEGAGLIGFNIRPEGGKNDVITGLTLTNPDPESGDFYYDGQRLAYDKDGKVILPPAGLSEEELKDWTFDTDKLEFMPSDTFGGTVRVKVEATVEDASSGATKSGFVTELPVEVTPVATRPTDFQAESEFSETDPGIWVLSLSASFADTDGSEEHFFLFKIPDGLVLEGEYPGLVPALGPNGESGYWKVTVAPTDSSPELDLKFRAGSDWDGESGVEYHAGASENGKTAWADAPAGGNEASPADDGGFPSAAPPTGDSLDDSLDAGLTAGDVLDNDGDGDGSKGATEDSNRNDSPDGDFSGADDTGGSLSGDSVGGAIGGGIDTDSGGICAGENGEGIMAGELGNNADGFAGDALAGETESGDSDDTLYFSDVFGDEAGASSLDDILGCFNSGRGERGGEPMGLEDDAFALTAGCHGNAASNTECGSGQQATETGFAGTDSYCRLPGSADDAMEAMRSLINQGVL